MATLHLENFPDPLYDRLQERARQERRSLAQEVIHLLEQAGEAPLLHRSIMELRGLGKECWSGVDPGSHIRVERDSWSS